MMQWYEMLYLIGVFIAALIAATLTVYAWHHRQTPGTLAFAGIMASITIWSFAVGMRAISQTDGLALFWHKAMSLGYVSVPVVFLAFVFHYTSQDRWLTRQRLILLSILPCLTQLVIWTNEFHGLYIQSVNFSSTGLLTVVEHQLLGPWYWVHTVYSYFLLLIGTLRIVLTILHGSYLYRWQAIRLLVGMCPPLVLNALHTVYLLPPRLSFTPIGFTLMGVVFAWTIFRHRFLDLAPVARSALVNIMRDGMLAVDLQDRIVDLNPAMQKIINISSHDATGQPVAKALQCCPALTEHIAKHVDEQVEICLVHEGTPRYYDLKGSSLFNQRGRLTGRLFVLHDITGRKRAEAALLAAHNELKETNERLQEANACKDRFFSIISHDLRSPLTTLLGYIQLLQNTADAFSSAQLHHYLEKAHVSAERLNVLLDNLLTWSRLQRNAMGHEPEQVNLQEIAEDNIDLFASKAEQKHIRLNSTVPHEIWAYADYNMVNTVIRNLISNALKFTDSRDSIEISARKNATSVEVAVADSGVGICQEDLSKLFRIDVHHTNVGTAGETGTGLGLALCQELVERNGGRIWAESALGHGSTFRFTLPKGEGNL